MKKIACVILLLVMCCTLCACDPGEYQPPQEALDKVVSVELIQYANSEQKEYLLWIFDHYNELLPFVAENATVLEVLPADKLSDFLQSFSQKTLIGPHYASYNSPGEICLRLKYENGDFLIVWADNQSGRYSGYVGEYSSNGAVLSYWGVPSNSFDYEGFVNEYFDYELKLD